MSHTLKFRGAEGQLLFGEALGDPARPPVILAHGGGQTRRAWRATIGLLSEAGFRAIALDLRGHGESDWSPEGNYAITDFADDLIAVCDQISDRPHLIGASLGGLAGLVAEGRKRPGTFATLTLVDIAPNIEPTGVARVMGFMSAHMERGFANVEEAAVTIAAYMPDRKKSASGPEGLRRYLRQGDDGRFRWHWDPRFVAGVMQTRAAADSAEMLSDAAANLRLPVHLIRGGSSDMISDDGLLAFKALVPGATYTDIVGAGHMVVGDQNDSFSHAVLEFLTQLAPS